MVLLKEIAMVLFITTIRTAIKLAVIRRIRMAQQQNMTNTATKQEHEKPILTELLQHTTNMAIRPEVINNRSIK